MTAEGCAEALRGLSGGISSRAVICAKAVDQPLCLGRSPAPTAAEAEQLFSCPYAQWRLESRTATRQHAPFPRSGRGPAPRHAVGQGAGTDRAVCAGATILRARPDTVCGTGFVVSPRVFAADEIVIVTMTHDPAKPPCVPTSSSAAEMGPYITAGERNATRFLLAESATMVIITPADCTGDRCQGLFWKTLGERAEPGMTVVTADSDEGANRISWPVREPRDGPIPATMAGVDRPQRPVQLAGVSVAPAFRGEFPPLRRCKRRRRPSAARPGSRARRVSLTANGPNS